MRVPTTIALSILLLSGFVSAAEYEVYERLQSDYGEIQNIMYVDEDGDRRLPSYVTLNGKVIYNGYQKPHEEPFIDLHGIYRFKGGQALLISQNCGGSGCRIDPLTFILLDGKSDPVFVTSSDFNSETYTLKAQDDSGKVVVDLGFYRQKKKTAILDDSGHLSILLQDDFKRDLGDDQCKSLYEATDSCVRNHSWSTGCFDYTTTDFSTGGFSGSNAEVWAVRWVSHFPGFNREGFIQACNSACKSGEKDNYEIFKYHACISPL